MAGNVLIACERSQESGIAAAIAEQWGELLCSRI